MLKDVGMTMLKVQEQDKYLQTYISNDCGIRNKKQHEGSFVFYAPLRIL